MPILAIKVSAQKSASLAIKINDVLLELTSNILNKKRELTSVIIDYIEPEDWTIGGKTLVTLGKNTFYLNITITDETNTKEEKARYIAAVFKAFDGILGNLHEESYIYIQDARATAYGYGGLTQEYRYHVC